MHRRGFQFRRLRDSEGRSAESALSVRQCSEKGFTFTERAVCERQHTDTHTDSETSRLVPRIGDLKRPKNNRTPIFFFLLMCQKIWRSRHQQKKYFSTFIFNSQGDVFVFLFFFTVSLFTQLTTAVIIPRGSKCGTPVLKKTSHHGKNTQTFINKNCFTEVLFLFFYFLFSYTQRKKKHIQEFIRSSILLN